MSITLRVGALAKPSIKDFDFANNSIRHHFDITTFCGWQVPSPIHYIRRHLAEDKFLWQKESHVCIDLKVARTKYQWKQKKTVDWHLVERCDLPDYGKHWYLEFFDKKSNVVYPELSDFTIRPCEVGIADVVETVYDNSTFNNNLPLGYFLDAQSASILLEAAEKIEDIQQYYHRLLNLLNNWETGKHIIYQQ